MNGFNIVLKSFCQLMIKGLAIQTAYFALPIDSILMVDLNVIIFCNI